MDRTAQSAKWRNLNRERHNFLMRRWNKTNIERRREIVKRYAESHRSERAAREALRRARKKNVCIGDRGNINKIYARAEILRQWFDVVVDHILPLSMGGAHASSNLQIIYARDNERKGSSLDYKPSVVFT